MGITIGYIITICISANIANGSYYPCVPALVEESGSELNAVVLQTVLCGILGAAFGGSSVIWQIERWSLAKQTGIYFLIVSTAMLPVAWFAYWMDHSVAGFFSYFGIFALIFAVVWIVEMLIARRNVRDMNAKLPGDRVDE